MSSHLKGPLYVGGIPVVGGGIPAVFGQAWFVDYRNGSDSNDGKSTSKALKTLSAAYAKAVSNRNDLILIDGDSTIEEDSMITWSKNRIHVVGLGGGFLTGQRTKIQLSSTGNAAAVAATLTVSGVGNTFRNLKVMNSGTDAASVACLIDSGEANYFENCSFMKFTDLDQTTVSDVEIRSDSTTYVNCEFGFDTLTQSVARPTMRIKASGSTRMKHNRFIDCIYTCQSSSADKQHILVENTSSLAFENLWKGCVFNAAILSSTSAVTLTNAVASVSGLVEGNLHFVDCSTTCTNFCAGVTDNVKVSKPASSNNANESVTPA